MNRPLSGEGPPPGRITFEEAAELLDTDVADVDALVTQGTLLGDRRARHVARSDVLVLRWLRRDELSRVADPDSPPDWEHEWLHPRQVGRRLGMSDQTVTQRLRNGELPGVKRLGRWWVRADQLPPAAG